MPTTVDPSDVIIMASSITGELMAGNSMNRRDATKVVLKRLVRQLPPHDFDSRHCGSLRGDEEQSVMDEFVETRVRAALGRGLVQRWSGDDRTLTSCHQCSVSVLPGQATVSATRANAQTTPTSAGPVWHVGCFVCSCCLEPLVEQIYFWSSDRGQVYCGRHHAETMRPRCAACDEIIFADECTEADNNFWHVSHFRCTDCQLPLAGKRYVIVDGEEEDRGKQPYCFQCYHTVLANFCRSCGRIVEVGQRHVTVPGTGCWHADGNCFRCDQCRRSLVGRSFFHRQVASSGVELLCSEECCSERHRQDTSIGCFRQTNETFAEDSVGVEYVVPLAPSNSRRCVSSLHSTCSSTEDDEMSGYETSSLYDRIADDESFDECDDDDDVIIDTRPDNHRHRTVRVTSSEEELERFVKTNNVNNRQVRGSQLFGDQIRVTSPVNLKSSVVGENFRNACKVTRV